MIDMADQELFMIQDDTDEAYAKEHAEELAAESKSMRSGSRITLRKKRIKEMYKM